MAMNPFFSRLLGLQQLGELRDRLRSVHLDRSVRVTAGGEVLGAVVLATVPLLIHLLSTRVSAREEVLIMGAACVLALFLRHRIGVRASRPTRVDFKFVHTAVAVGCIPAVFVMVYLTTINPQLGWSVQKVRSIHQSTGGGRSGLPALLSFAALVSIWAGLTEEILFRGLLVSTLRRWRPLLDRGLGDAVALIVSALLFALCHVGTWGPALSIAIFGLGFGFGLGYLASREKLVAVVCYHVLFDFLSVLAPFWMAARMP